MSEEPLNRDQLKQKLLKLPKTHVAEAALAQCQAWESSEFRSQNGQDLAKKTYDKLITEASIFDLAWALRRVAPGGKELNREVYKSFSINEAQQSKFIRDTLTHYDINDFIQKHFSLDVANKLTPKSIEDANSIGKFMHTNPVPNASIITQYVATLFKLNKRNPDDPLGNLDKNHCFQGIVKEMSHDQLKSLMKTLFDEGTSSNAPNKNEQFQDRFELLCELAEHDLILSGHLQDNVENIFSYCQSDENLQRLLTDYQKPFAAYKEYTQQYHQNEKISGTLSMADMVRQAYERPIELAVAVARANGVFELQRLNGPEKPDLQGLLYNQKPSP